jgi:hypothetical protein
VLAAGPRAKTAEAELKAALKDNFIEVRMAASAALIRSGAPVAANLPALSAGFVHKEAAVRAMAIELLARTGLASDVVVPQLLKAQSDAEVGVRLAALRGFVALSVKDPRIVDGLRRMATSKDEAERNETLAAIPKLTDIPVAEFVHAGGWLRGDRIQRAHVTAVEKSTAEPAVAAALDWLARHQSPNGEWDACAFDSQCKLNRCQGPGESTFTRGTTALALLCFLGAGETPSQGVHKECVARGLVALRSVMNTDGFLGDHEPGAPPPGTGYKHGGWTGSWRHSNGVMYNQAIGTAALCEAFMLTGDPDLRIAAEKTATFTLKVRVAETAWGDTLPADGQLDTSVTGWCVWALAVARASRIELPNADAAITNALRWIEQQTDPQSGRTGYDGRGGAPARTNEMMQKYPADRSEAPTSVAIAIRAFAGRLAVSDEPMRRSADLVAKRVPKWDADAGTIDFYYWFWGAMAMRQCPGVPQEDWLRAMRNAVAENQITDKKRDEFGSWEPIDPWSAQGGRIYSTAMCCMALESCWRMDPSATAK